MFELINIGINENSIISLIDNNELYKELTMKQVYDKVYLLKNVLCTDNQIKKIIENNKEYLLMDSNKIIDLFNILFDMGFENINDLIFSSPSILNIDSNELKKYIEYREYKGENHNDIVNDISSTLFEDLI